MTHLGAAHAGASSERLSDTDRLLDPEFRRLLDACANQLALALERDHLGSEATNARIQAKTIRSGVLFLPACLMT